MRERVRKEAHTHLLSFSSQKSSKYCVVDEVIELIRKILPEGSLSYSTILGDLVKEKDIVLLVTPIDLEAPQGRMILPQMMAIRDCLDHEKTEYHFH